MPPWVAIGGLLACLYPMAALPFATWGRLFVWLALGLAIYVAYGRRNVERARATAGRRGGAERGVLVTEPR